MRRSSPELWLKRDTWRSHEGVARCDYPVPIVAGAQYIGGTTYTRGIDDLDCPVWADREEGDRDRR